MVFETSEWAKYRSFLCRAPDEVCVFCKIKEQKERAKTRKDKGTLPKYMIIMDFVT